MERFARFDPESIARWLRAAQAAMPDSADVICPRCGQGFTRSEITETKGPSRYVGYMYRCPRCREFSPASRFRYPKDEGLELPRGRGQHIYDPERILGQMPLRTSPHGMESAIQPRSGPWKDDWSNRPTIGRSQP